MGSVTGRWALVLAVASSIPTLLVHLLDGARLVTIAWRTCVAILGSLSIGLGLEWYVGGIWMQARNQSQSKGRHLDLKVGPTDQEQMGVIVGHRDENKRE